MKTTNKTVEGVAYLIGGEKKATLETIDSLALAVPEKNRTALRKFLLGKLTVAFKVKDVEVTEPETLEEAIEKLPNGRETLEKMAIAKVVTNQLDEVRRDTAENLVKERKAEVALAMSKVAEFMVEEEN